MTGIKRSVLIAVGLLLIGACVPNTTTNQAKNIVPPSAGTEASPSPSPSPQALTIGSLPFHSGEVGATYGAIALTASGGTIPYNWTVSAGTFPPGLVLASDGTVSGTSTTAGVFSFTVNVADSAGQSTNGAGKITVYSALAVTQPCATRCTIGAGCTRCGSFGSVSGGQAPYSYRIASGAVPSGMSWSALSLGGGFPAGTYNLSVQVSDASGGAATVNANWSIYSPATLKSGGNCVVINNTGPQCTVRWPYSGGHPSTAPQAVILGYAKGCNALGLCATPTTTPVGWAVKVGGGIVQISAGPIACNTPNYIGTIRLALADKTSCATTSLSNEVDLLVDLENNC